MGRPPPRVWFVTSNPGKLGEAQAALAPLGVAVEQRKVPYPEVQADTLEEVARFGAPFVARDVEPPFVLEDSGLFVDALGGFPGVYSAYVLRTLGLEGVLRLMEGRRDRAARFESRLLLVEGGDRVEVFSGSVAGRIAPDVRGALGFGFDPIFVPDEGDGRTFGEYPVAEKNALSHRGRALAGLVGHWRQRAAGPKEG